MRFSGWSLWAAQPAIFVTVRTGSPCSAIYTDADEDLGGCIRISSGKELNVKAMFLSDDVSEFTAYTFKPQLKLLGQNTAKIGEIRTVLQNLDGSPAKKELDADGVLKLQLADGEISLTEEELLIDTAQKEGFTSVSERGLTVVLDTNPDRAD